MHDQVGYYNIYIISNLYHKLKNSITVKYAHTISNANLIQNTNTEQRSTFCVGVPKDNCLLDIHTCK